MMPRNSFTAHICVHLYAHLSAASTCAFRFAGDTISRHFTAAFRTLSCYLSRLARMQFIAHFNQITAAAVLTLQSFLQLKYQGINDHSQSVFSTHPAAMRVAVASSAVYCFAYAALLRFPLHPFSFLAHHLLVSSGYIAVASLASPLLTDTAAAIVYAAFGLISAAELLFWVHVREQNEVESWFQRGRIRRLLNNIRGDVAFDVSRQWMRRRLPV